MNGKISDFRIAEHLLRLICAVNNVDFVDIPIKIGEKNGLEKGFICISQTKNIGHTIFKIISNYINNSGQILKKDLFLREDKKNNFLIYLANFLRGLLYFDESEIKESDNVLSLQRLYQRPLVWLLMKDLVCPLFDIKIKNIKIVFGSTPYIDIAKYYEKNVLKNGNYSFVFVNEIDCSVIKNAFIFLEVIKAHFLNPCEIIKVILESDLNKKFRGLLLLALSNEEDVDEFVDIITTLLNLRIISNYLKVANKSDNINKIAQFTAEHPSSWWYLGLIENQLENARGTDWSDYIDLNKYVKEFWDKVEKIKRKKEKSGNKDGIPFDSLLRLKSKQTVDYDIDHQKTLQSLLGSDRIW